MATFNPLRTEQDVFSELSSLCTSSGYVHAIAYFCYRDHVVGYGETLKSSNYAKLFSNERLIRTEVSTLLGLMVRKPINFLLPDPATLQLYIERTESLLRELHECLNQPALAELQKAFRDPDNADNRNPFAKAELLREPIFYGAESAYSFQYRDLAVHKYEKDDKWLQDNRGFSLPEARAVVIEITNYVNKNLFDKLKNLKNTPPNNWTMLPGFRFTISDINSRLALPASKITAIVDAFTYSNDGNPTFQALNDFNAINAFPIIRDENNDRILFLYVALTESLYETPFYWMSGDKSYVAIAMKNRGAFTESFTNNRLSRVFGNKKVFCNVDIWDTPARKRKLGEIDTLVIAGDRAIVVQAKSKKLTLAARKGNDLQVQADFKAAVQDACDQAVSCSKSLLKRDCTLVDISGNELTIPGQLAKIHPLCVVADHYPALSFQAQQLLSFDNDASIEPPLVCDVFFIDVVTEFLETPLRFLSYLELRARAANKLNLSHEIVALGYHLRRNLWLDENDFVALDDDISVDIDIAMAARRDGVIGEKTPPGILTHLKGTVVGRIIEEVEKRYEPSAMGTGLELLKLSSSAANDLSRLIDKIVRDAEADGKLHDATIATDHGSSGITVHCSALPKEIALPELQRHCEVRKYSCKANHWFGIAVHPGSGDVHFGIMLDKIWKREAKLESVIQRLPVQAPFSAIGKLIRGAKHKIGRNDPCPCGSGLKYKKCHCS